MGFKNSGSGATGYIGIDGFGYKNIDAGALFLTTWTANNLILGTNQNERMRISSTGDITMKNNLFINNSSPTIHLQDTDNISSMIHCNSSTFYILKGDANNSITWAPFANGRWPLQLNLTTGEMLVPQNINITGTNGLILNARWKIVSVQNGIGQDLNFVNTTDGESVAISWQTTPYFWHLQDSIETLLPVLIYMMRNI
jgi:hypothetical protein